MLLKVLDARQPHLRTHLRDIADLAVRVARRLGLPDHETEEIVRAAELHDIGKMAVPDAILDKPGPLEPEEWAFIRQHTIVGERILAAAPSLAGAARLVRSSHERWDGSGYPDGLEADEIPLGARIIAVCDAYDAMVTPRPHREAVSPHDALAELRRCAGTQFDPRVVDLFEQELREHAAPGSSGALAGAPPAAVQAHG